jgi:hypothetical protein
MIDGWIRMMSYEVCCFEWKKWWWSVEKKRLWYLGFKWRVFVGSRISGAFNFPKLTIVMKVRAISSSYFGNLFHIEQLCQTGRNMCKQKLIHSIHKWLPKLRPVLEIGLIVKIPHSIAFVLVVVMFGCMSEYLMIMIIHMKHMKWQCWHGIMNQRQHVLGHHRFFLNFWKFL